MTKDKISLIESKHSGKNKYNATTQLGESDNNESSNGDHKKLVPHVEEFTIQEAIDHCGFGWFQLKLSVIAGLTWMADSMEIMLLSILGPVLSCEWYLKPWQQALLTTLVMVGMASGSSFWGSVSDKHGRRTALALASSMIGYFGLLSAFSPMYLWMAICRFLVGCCLAALPQTVTLYSEYLPTQSRATALIFLEVFFAIGSCFEVVLAMVVMPTLGWRYLMAFSAIPVLFFPALSPWLPESARFLLTSGRYKDAVAMLERVAKENGKPMLKGKLCHLSVEKIERGGFKDLYKPSSRRLTGLLNVLWFCLGFSYYGMALLLPTLLHSPDGCHGTDAQSSYKASCSVSCTAFTFQDYADLAITSFADAPGLFVGYLFLLVLGRRSSMALATTIFSIFLFFSNICMNRATLTALMFVIKAMISGAHQILYIYTSECYPTSMRALGLGLCSGLARVGAVVTPYLAQVGTEWSAFLSFTMYGGVGLAASAIALLLPFDTSGRAMVDLAH